MSHLRVYLLAFCVLGVVVAAFAAENVNCDEEVPPASEETILSLTEKMWGIKLPWQKKTASKKASFSAFMNEVDRSGALDDVAPAFIGPGLKWCGDGNRAENEDDLGRFKDTDACCREHDNCNSNIEAGGTKLNLKNNGYFTRSHCSCDDQFYKCLKKANAVVAYTIGKTYFNVLGPQCFACICPDNCPEEGCKECTRYKWRNNPSY